MRDGEEERGKLFRSGRGLPVDFLKDLTIRILRGKDEKKGREDHLSCVVLLSFSHANFLKSSGRYAPFLTPNLNNCCRKQDTSQV